MTDPTEDPSMAFLRALSKDLASREIAQSMSDMIITLVFGEAELERQTPLSIVDGGDRWTVTGNQDYGTAAAGFSQILEGPVIIEIAKRNCAVLMFKRMVTIGPPP